ncbi:MAG: RusA family crossover junction endodeoxyribonuclease [Clostridiaceae bacterium]
MKIEFTVPGEPKGKARLRMSTKTGRTYTPGTTVQYENWVKQCFIMCDTKCLFEGQIKAEIDCYYSIPKSATKGKRLAMEHNITRPTKKPDADNIAKSILDSLNTLAYRDDSQVVECLIRKWYGDEPRVEVIIEELGQ